MISEPTTKEKLRVVKANREILGFWTTLRMILAYLLSGHPHDSFDKRFRVSTAGVVEPEDAGIPEEGIPYAIRYYPTHERVMRHVLKNLPIDYRDYVFVDLGCGKGRAVLMASEFPFQRVVGVELSPKTSAIAKENVATFGANASSQRCRNVEILCENAIDFGIPSSNVVFYLYHPFREPVFGKVVENIRRASRKDRRILIAYCCPANEVVLQKSGFRKTREFKAFSVEHSWSLWEDPGSDS